MTTKEIAETVGKDARTVRNWIADVAEKNSAMAEKISSSSSTYPADFSIEETVEIIREGLGDSAAMLFMENAYQRKPEKRPIDHRDMAELRRAFDRGLISADEYRAGIGLNYPKSDMLDPGIAKQVYAVTCSAIDKKKKALELESKSKELF